MTKYRRKPTEIEAVQWDGSVNAGRSIVLMGAEFNHANGIDARLLAGVAGAQGAVNVPVGHWIAKADDHFYPIDPEIFAQIYEAVDD
jgi:hypothetical protein